MSARLLIAFLLINFLACAQEDVQSDLAYHELQNGVFKVRETVYYRDTTQASSIRIMEFDKKEFQVRSELYTSPTEEETPLIQTSKYLRNWTLCQGRTLSGDVVLEEQNSRLDEQGRMISQISFKKKGDSLIYEAGRNWIYSKDSMEFTEFDKSRKLYLRRVVYYNDQGQIIRRHATVGSHTRSDTKNYYDDQGRLIREVTYSNGKLKDITYWSYEGENTTTYITYEKDSTISAKVITSVNEHGHIIYNYSYYSWNSKAKERVYVYIYDQKQNWIRQEAYNTEGQLTELRIREIEYFE